MIDGENCQIVKDGEVTKIDPIVARLGLYFAEHPNTIITRQELSDNVWLSSHTSDDAINRSVSTLRKSLGGKRDEFIKTIPKQGYRFAIGEHIELTIIHDETIADTPPEVDVEQAKPEIELESQPEQVLGPDTSIRATPISELPERPNKLYHQIYGSMVLIAIVTGLWFYQPKTVTPNSSQVKVEEAAAQAPQLNVQDANSKIRLVFNRWQVAADEHGLPESFAYMVEQAVVANIGREGKFDVQFGKKWLDFGAEQVPNEFEVRFDVSTDGEFVNGKLTLTDLHDESAIEVIDLTYMPQQALSAEAFFADEISAALRLYFFYASHLVRYRGAFESLNYTGVEQLLIARDYIYLRSVGSKAKGTMILDELNERYPNNPYVLGLKTSSLSERIDMREGDIFALRKELAGLIEQVLSLDPTNSDALRAHFYDQFSRVGKRNKAENIAQTLMKFHPYDQRSWRPMLMHKIMAAEPCEDIRAYVNAIPKDVFKPVRLKVIGRILDICTGKVVQEDIMAPQLSEKVRTREVKALLNNLYLFGNSHDKLAEMTDELVKMTNSPRKMLVNYWVHLAMGDVSRAKAIEFESSDGLSEYSKSMARALAYIHELSDIKRKDAFVLPDYGAMDRLADMYFVAAAIKYQRANHVTAPIERYVEGRPPFEISILNRFESLAKMMALREHGDIVQSEQVALRLFKVLENYRQQHNESYHFFNLGRFELLSAFYCGESCQLSTQNPEQQLSNWFKNDRVWWPDDYHFVTIALSFWPQHPVANAYLDNISQDKNRLNGKMGF